MPESRGSSDSPYRQLRARIVGGDYPLSEVASAHEDLRARRTVGKLVLDPTH